ncbi:MAG: hypothetical protein GY856_24610 [bacterium]|nr:hypothetical protein [bacterium]
MAWLRFGSPVAGLNPPAIGGFRSSTEEEFELAYRSWATIPRTQSLFYRCRRLPEQLSDISGDQFAHIDQFFSRFQAEDKCVGRYGEFTIDADLEERLESDLTRIIQSIRESQAVGLSTPASRRAKPPPRPDTETRPLAEFEKKMQTGKAYEVSFLSLEIAGFSEIVQQFVKQQPDVDIMLRSFRRLAVDTAAGYGGEIFSWQVERGLLIFWSQRSYDHAIITGLKVIHSLPVFNIDPQQNPLPTNIEIRTAAHDAVIVFRSPITEITSPDMDFVVQMRENFANPGELAITKRLFERADSRLKPRFKFKGRFEREPVYSCILPSTEQHALQSKLEELTGKVKNQTALIKQLLSDPDALDAAGSETATVDGAVPEPPAIESMSAAVDETYALLNQSSSVLNNINKTWSTSFFSQLAGTVSTLVVEEAGLWKVLRKCHLGGKTSPATATKLESIVRAAASLRSRPAVTLSKIRESLQTRASGEAAVAPRPSKVDEDLNKKIDFLLRADPLDQETALTDLLLNKKGALLEYLQSQPAEKRSTRLLDKLWEAADLVLLDDMYSIRGHQRADEEKVYDTLIDEPVADGRFRVVRELLSETFKPSEALVKQHFSKIGVEAEVRDLQIAWRCLILGHPVPSIRNLCAFKLSQFSLWQAISHPNIPIASIHAIGERVAKVENEDAKKIFFDCTRSRIATAVEAFRTRGELSAITNLIMLFLDFSFLVETGYFERFDDILGGFLSRSQKMGLKVEYFENLRKRLENVRRDPDTKTAGKPPAGVKKLPLTLQRRLAGEAQYLFWFVTHPDARIACETLRHIGLANIDRVLKLAEVNGVVMASLLRKPELFTRSQAIISALNNPKSDLLFATRHIPSLMRSQGGLRELEKIARNPSANPAIRASVKNAIQQRKSKR